MPDLAKYRKGVVAVVAAGVTVANLAGVPLAAGLSDGVLGVFDSLAALLVIAVPNSK